MSSQAVKQKEFMLAGGQRVYTLNEVINMKASVPKEAYLYMNLIEEEKKELDRAFNILSNTIYPDEKLAALADLLDQICDLKVVISGLSNSLGLPEDMAYDEVHKSNMNKFVRSSDGKYKVIKREDGKVIKPADWSPPDILSILKYKLVTGG